MNLRLALGLILVLSGCASHAIWLNAHPPVLDDYPVVHVRIYRAGINCRLEVITLTETIITLPTRCLNVPHIPRP